VEVVREIGRRAWASSITRVIRPNVDKLTPRTSLILASRWQLVHRRWHIVEIVDATTGESVHVHVAVVVINGKYKAITKPIWHSQSVEEAEANYNKRFKIDSSYKDKHAFLARTSSRSWAVRLVLFLVSVLLENAWKLALAWTFLKGLPPISKGERRELTKKEITNQLYNFLIYEGWKL